MKFNSKHRRQFILLCAFFMAMVLTPSPRADAAQPCRLVDGHTAGVLNRGYFDVDLNVYGARSASGAGLLMGVHVGITNRFTLGLSYGGEGIIGYGDGVRWNSYPGALVKYRLFEEKFATPAFSIGFDNQGYGGPADAGAFGYDGYIYKSPGFFLAISKSYVMAGAVQIGFHGTVNYSLEEIDNVTWPNYLLGMDIGINDELVFVIEYNLAVDDVTGEKDSYGNPFYGFLNFGLRWAFSPNFQLEFVAKDVFENKTRIVLRYPDPQSGRPVDVRRPIGWSRELRVTYINKF